MKNSRREFLGLSMMFGLSTMINASPLEQLIDIEKRLKKPKVLPGPTGESNILYLENRGNIICFADENVSFHSRPNE